MIRWIITGVAGMFVAVFAYQHNWPALVLMILLWIALISIAGSQLAEDEYKARIRDLESRTVIPLSEVQAEQARYLARRSEADS